MTGLAVPLWERWIWMKTGVLQIRLLIQIKLFNSISTVPRVQHLISSHVDILSNYCPSCRPFSQVWSSLSLWHLFLPRCSLSPKRAKSSSKCLHWWNPKSSINVNPSKHVTNDSPILISIYTYIYIKCVYIYICKTNTHSMGLSENSLPPIPKKLPMDYRHFRYTNYPMWFPFSGPHTNIIASWT